MTRLQKTLNERNIPFYVKAYKVYISNENVIINLEYCPELRRRYFLPIFPILVWRIQNRECETDELINMKIYRRLVCSRSTRAYPMNFHETPAEISRPILSPSLVGWRQGAIARSVYLASSTSSCIPNSAVHLAALFFSPRYSPSHFFFFLLIPSSNRREFAF